MWDCVVGFTFWIIVSVVAFVVGVGLHAFEVWWHAKQR